MMLRVVLASLILACTGCGQTGELFLPPVDDAAAVPDDQSPAGAATDGESDAELPESTQEQREDDEKTPAG